MALPGLKEQAFDRHAAQHGQIDDVGVLDAVAEAPTGRDERVGQPKPPQLDRQVGGVHEVSQSIAAPSNTGPPMHERT